MGERGFLVGGQRTFEPMNWEKEKGKYKDPEANNKLPVFKGTARRPIWLRNELKMQQKEIKR